MQANVWSVKSKATVLWFESAFHLHKKLCDSQQGLSWPQSSQKRRKANDGISTCHTDVSRKPTGKFTKKTSLDKYRVIGLWLSPVPQVLGISWHLINWDLRSFRTKKKSVILNHKWNGKLFLTSLNYSAQRSWIC